MPLMIILFKDKIIKQIKNDPNIDFERKDNFISILTSNKKLLGFSLFTLKDNVINFKTLLDKNIIALSIYKKDKGDELDINITSIFGVLYSQIYQQTTSGIAALANYREFNQGKSYNTKLR